MTRPWEIAVARPWEAAQSLYPRRVTVKRPTSSGPSGGLLAYQGVRESAEVVVATGLPAVVDIASSGRNSSVGGLPADAPGPIKWTITLPPWIVATIPQIEERDVIYDDLGRRFHVSAYEPHPLGARIDVVRVEA